MTRDPGAAERSLEFATAVCDHVFECCTADDFGKLLGNSELDYGFCRIYLLGLWEGFHEMIIQVAAGRLEFDEDAFHECTKSLAAHTCGFIQSLDVLYPGAFCPEAWVPKVPPGDACLFSLECTTAQCVAPEGEEIGTCVPLVGLGGDCASSYDCEPQLHCSDATSKCAPGKPDGADCSLSAECQSGACVGGGATTGHCGLTSVCQGGGSGPGLINEALVATLVAQNWAECAKSVECCGGSKCAVGEAESGCFLPLFFFNYDLFRLHRRWVEGKVALDGPALSACVDELSSRSCEDYAEHPGFSCPGAIVGLVPNGMECLQHVECAEGYCGIPVAGVGHTCGPLPGEGEACKDVCAEGLYCKAGTCTSVNSPGEPCEPNTGACAEGSCVGPEGGPTTCTLVCDGE